jgi:spore coat protein U-like protein
MNRLRENTRHTVRRHMLAFVLLLCGRDAYANECSATMTDIAFGNVSPVSGQDYVAMGTLSVTCTFVILAGNIILLPNINLCANLGPGTGSTDVNARVLTSGARKIPFNLYRSAAYTGANIWGAYATQMHVPVFFGGLLAVGTSTQTFPVYAKINAADLAGVPTVANGDTAYATDFTGAGNILYSSATLLVFDCQFNGQTAPFTFAVRANVVNDCVISTTPLSFGSQGRLAGATRALGSLGVKCTAASSYRIALGSGLGGATPVTRKMRNLVTGETVAYSLSTTLDGPEWGDGTAGSTTFDATGTGFAQDVPIYGRVPGQRTPTPGDYADKVTATIYF